MPCRTIIVGDGVRVIACSRGRSAARCTSCKTRPASKLCDYPVKRDGKEATCDRALCTRCAVRSGVNHDNCPPHARALARGMVDKTPW